MSIVQLRPMPASAEAWCARLNADDVSDAERVAFAAWLNAAPENRAEYELCRLTFAVARGLHVAPELRITSLREHKEPRGRFPVSRRTAVAASAGFLVCAAALIAWQYLSPAYVTGVGERRTVPLADGSTVQMNTATAMNIDMDDSSRSVTLRHGEAFFNVENDPARPFVVRAGRSEIRVLGTQFNVRMNGDTAQVVVTEGRVSVVNLSGGTQTSSAAVEVLPGQGVSVATAGPVLRQNSVNTARLTAWREGKLLFEQDALSTVLDEVNRYTGMQFVIADPRVSGLRLSGVFRAGDADSVAFALHEAYGLRIERERNRIVVR